MSAVLRAARAWHAAGFGVIPIRPDGTKRPALSAWEPYQHRRATEAELQEWFGLDRVGVAVICGAVSDNLEVLDFDDPDVWPEYEAACSAHDLGAVLARCPLAETPSGGRHVLYRCAVAVEGNQKLALYADGRKARIETRGEGGYAVAPPSGPACHEAGKPYRFLRGRPNTVQTLTADERRGLLAVARMFDLAEPEAWAAPPARSAGPQDRDRPGDAYNETDEFEAELEAAGWRRAGTSDGWRLWRRPGKTGPGHSAKSGTWQGRRCFVNYSSSVPEFTEKRGYSPFAVYAILCHGGDFIAAATALSGAVPNRREPRGAEAGPPSPVAPQAPQVGQPAGETGIAQATALHGIPYPELGQMALHGIAGDFVRLAEPYTESDPAALLLQFLAFFGNVVDRYAYFAVEQDRHYANIFIVLVGDTAKGRKGTSESHVRGLFTKVAPDWVADNIASGLSSGEGLIYHVRDAVDRDEMNKKTGKRVTVVSDYGVSDKRLLIVEPEFASVLKQVEREGNTLSPVLRDAWDRGKLRTLTKNSPLRASSAHVSIVGHVTAQELRKRLSATEAANGFANRFLWACVKRSKELPFGGSPEGSALLGVETRLREAIKLAHVERCVPWAEESRPIWAGVYSGLSSGRPGLLGAVTSRAEAQTARLALLYALLDCSDEIRPEHLRAALALWRYVAASAAYVFGDSLGDRQTDELLQALRDAGSVGMTRTAIREHFSNNLPEGRTAQILGMLESCHLASKTERSTGGRPAEVWIAP